MEACLQDSFVAEFSLIRSEKHYIIRLATRNATNPIGLSAPPGLAIALIWIPPEPQRNLYPTPPPLWSSVVILSAHSYAYIRVCKPFIIQQNYWNYNLFFSKLSILLHGAKFGSDPRQFSKLSSDFFKWWRLFWEIHSCVHTLQ